MKFKVAKAIQQARFLSGRYRSAYLGRHWNKLNPEGLCLSETCEGAIEDTKHILLDCNLYNLDRKNLLSFWFQNSDENVRELIIEALGSNPTILLQFILDCSSLPFVVKAAQSHGVT